MPAPGVILHTAGALATILLVVGVVLVIIGAVRAVQRDYTGGAILAGLGLLVLLLL